MVRAYFPQSFPNDLETNTNTPSQGSGPGGGGPPPPVSSNELHEESAGVTGNLIYDDGTETGNVKIEEGPLIIEVIEETSGDFDFMIYDDGSEEGLLQIQEI